MTPASVTMENYFVVQIFNPKCPWAFNQNSLHLWSSSKVVQKRMEHLQGSLRVFVKIVVVNWYTLSQDRKEQTKKHAQELGII